MNHDEGYGGLASMTSLKYDEMDLEEEYVKKGAMEKEPDLKGEINLLLSVKPEEYKFDEVRLIREIWDYIDGTYSQHYSQNKFQATEFIYDGGHGTGFNIGNVLKYAQRYGKKGSKADARKDLMKVIHYAILQLHVHDNEVE
jgi:hypothetical protein